MAHEWRAIATQAQQRRDDSILKIRPAIPVMPIDLPLNVIDIPKQVLTSEEITITEMPPEELLNSLASGNLSSFNVTNAFLRRAGLAQALVNCVTEVMPERALQRARYLDEYLTEHKAPIGPLHGLPISLKEHHSVKGLTINCGFIAWHDRAAQTDSHAVGLLLQAGAVIYVRTTEPQSLMHIEASSNFFGTTVNPYNRQLTCGGSSGGEGALIGLHGSCLGLGSDIGGSIRNPAAMNGIWGFRPSANRVPLYGVEAAMKGYDSIAPVIGPMSTSIEGLHLFMKAIIDQKPWKDDPSVLPIPWNYPPASTSSFLTKSDGQRRLRVAILWHDGVVRPHPPVERALRTIADKLRTDPNIKVSDWKPYKHDHAWNVLQTLYFPDGGNEIKTVLNLSGEPLLPLTTFILDEQPKVKNLKIAELWAANMQREIYRAEHNAIWNSTANEDQHGDPVDVIIAPVAPGAAPPLNHSKYFSYTAQWNLLDHPAMAFPCGHVDQDEDKLTDADKAYVPLGPQDEEAWKLWIDRDGPAGYKDAPIGLQIVGRRLEDEKVFEAMHWIKRVVGI